MLRHLPSAAKAAINLRVLCGMAEAMPFQNSAFFSKL
jgi:hypothetical protein